MKLGQKGLSTCCFIYVSHNLYPCVMTRLRTGASWGVAAVCDSSLEDGRCGSEYGVERLKGS